MDERSITRALQRSEKGEPGAAEQLWHLVYGDLRQIASSRLKNLQPGQTLQATALVHEAWMKMHAGDSKEWESRAHFYGVAALCMRSILVDQARRKNSLRRGVDAQELDLNLEIEATGTDADEILALDEALTALSEEYKRPAEIVMLRYFAGLTIAEIAEMKGISTRLVDRDFAFARTWLRRFLDRA